MPHPAIEIDNLTFTYQQVPILERVSLRIEEGEFIGIFGPNGGGKTTFLRLLLAFLKPSSGSIKIFGKEPRSARSLIGYVPQIARFDRQFPISVLEIVLMGCLSQASWFGSFSSSLKQAAIDALERVGMASFIQAPFGSLSGGQVQRVLLARAIVSNPKLLMLDEPTANVDPQAEGEIHRLLLDLKNTTTILMVTHDLQTIQKDVSRLLCIQRNTMFMQPADVCGHFALGLYHPIGS